MGRWGGDFREKNVQAAFSLHAPGQGGAPQRHGPNGEGR